MENKVIFKIFRTVKQMHITSTEQSYSSTIWQTCCDYVNEFEDLDQAIKWRNENQNFKNEYTIFTCY